MIEYSSTRDDQLTRIESTHIIQIDHAFICSIKAHKHHLIFTINFACEWLHNLKCLKVPRKQGTFRLNRFPFKRFLQNITWLIGYHCCSLDLVKLLTQDRRSLLSILDCSTYFNQLLFIFIFRYLFTFMTAGQLLCYCCYQTITKINRL